MLKIGRKGSDSRIGEIEGKGEKEVCGKRTRLRRERTNF